MPVGYGLAGGYTPQIDPNSIQTTDPSFMTRLRGAGKSFLGNRDLALALLANSSGPTRQSFGSILGQSMMQADHAKQGREDDAFKRQYMQAQMAAMGAKQQGPASVQEYEYAKRNGYKGSFQDWTIAGGQSSRPSSVQEWEFFNDLKPDEQRRYLEMKRNPPFSVQNIGGAPTGVAALPGGGIQTTPLSTLPREAAAAGAIAQAKGEGQTVGEAVGAQAGKAPAKSSMDYVISKFEPVLDKTAQGMVAGPLGKVFDYGDRRRFDNLREQLSTELRTVFRIPGEGTLSDREQQQYGLQLPDTSNPPDVNRAILNDIRARTQIRTETPIGGAPATAPGKKRRYNPATGKIE